MDDLRARARAALERHLGYPDFRPGQVELVEAALTGRDALGILPTGGGKSVTYQVPAALMDGLTVVVSPLLSLMSDQAARSCKAGIPAAYLGSTLPPEEARRVAGRVEAGVVRLLLVSPERFRSPAFLSLLESTRVALLAVDEAHCISQWGHDFRPDYLRLGEIRERVTAPVLAVTATATPRVRAEIARELRLRDPVMVVKSFDRPNLSWEVVDLPTRAGKLPRLHDLLRGVKGGVSVVYAATRKGVEGVRGRLAALGWPVEAYHAGLPAAERNRVQDRFMSGDARVVVATNAFGMGIDKPDVRLVVHVEISGSLEAYYQEAGRAGRDGGRGHCVVLHAPGDLAIHEGFRDRGYPDPLLVKRIWTVLSALQGDRRVGPVSLQLLALRVGLSRDEGLLLRGLHHLVEEGVLRVVTPGGLPDPEEEQLEGVVRPPLPTPVLQRLSGGAPPLHGLRIARSRVSDRLEAVAAYLATRGCRRAYLLRYFGERAPTWCGECDRCRSGAGAPATRGAAGGGGLQSGPSEG